MDVRIKSIHSHGNATKEHVQLTVDADCDLGDYMIVDTTYAKTGEISNELRHTFWFPVGDVEAGDVVVLRTGKGTDAKVEMANGHTKHRYHWGLRSSVWNDDQDTAVLLKIEDWSQRSVK